MTVSEIRRELGKLYNGAAKWRALLAKASDAQILAIWYRTNRDGVYTEKESIPEVPKYTQITLF